MVLSFRRVVALASLGIVAAACGSTGGGKGGADGSAPDGTESGGSGGSAGVSTSGGSAGTAGSAGAAGAGGTGGSTLDAGGGAGGTGGSTFDAGGAAGSGGSAGAGGSAGSGGSAGAGGSGGSGGSGDSGGPVTAPCDIYAADTSTSTPCVAAHSTVRALYGAYNGRLYQVKRASDGTTQDISTLQAGGFANSAAQDSFCSGTTCVISIIYDQSASGNHLTSGWTGGNAPSASLPASATALPVTISGHAVYGVKFDGDNGNYSVAANGYRNDTATGTATGNNPESEYMVTSSNWVNTGCCFDYGNAEKSATDEGGGTMEAVYFGTATSWGYGTGTGPWVMADMENNLFSGGVAGYNASDLTVTDTYVTAMVKGNGGSGWALKGGNAQSGTLTTMYNGPRPGGYDPMDLKGAIILGVGGDNSEGADGEFFEGVMTSGYAADATDALIQANIVGVYGH